ncbi:hypothetical protein SDC9_182363 [bioreactor metagenome]|uniref:Uncharacterized protein n=1 Tax=bioreactor metagenome TaxID=1076179 RepID=A0A645H9S9_9ZZZZ
MGKPCAFGVLFKDFCHAHLFSVVERHELKTWVNCHVPEGRLHIFKVMDTDGNFFPVSAQAPVQVFLKVHEGFDRRGRELHSPYNRTPKERPDFQDIFAYGYGYLVGLYLVFRKSGLNI